MANAWNDWKETTMNLARVGAAKAREVGEAARIRLDNLGEEENLRKIYLEIGRLYVSLHQDSPEEPYAELFQRLEESREKIRENERRLENLRNQGQDQGEWIPCRNTETAAEQEVPKEPESLADSPNQD